MKKSILLASIITTAIIVSTKNADAQQGIQLGIEGSPQISWIINNDDQTNKQFEYQNTFNGSFGISGQYGFTKNMGIGLNALYSIQGQRFKLSGIERTKQIEYLKIPLMFTYNYEFNSDIKFIGKIGPQLGVLTNAKLIDKDGDAIVGNHKEAYEDYDFEGVLYAGIGYKINDNVFIDSSLRFDYGFTDAENKNYTKNINNPYELIQTNGYSNNVNSRKNANNITSGLSFGIRYVFNNTTSE
jgi:hypothetical protein